MGDRWILGICDGQDAGAALVDGEGRLAFAVSEERLTRRSHQRGFPERAVRAALAERLSRGGRLDGVAVATRTGRWPARRFDRRYRGVESAPGPLHPVSRAAAAWSRAAARWFPDRSVRASKEVLAARLQALGVRAPLVLVDHYDSYAWAAAAGARDALVVTLDAFGDGAAGAVHRLDGSLRCCRRIPAPHSPALVVATAARTAGVGGGGIRHLEVRAAHGDPDRLRPAFASVLEVRDGVPRLIGREPLQRLARALTNEPPEDIAAALHAHVEEVTLQLIRQARHDFGGRQLRLGGGLFANASLVHAVALDALDGGMDDVFVFPATGDAGLCAGAAIAQRVALGGGGYGLDAARIGPLAWDENAPIPMRVPPLPIEESPVAARDVLKRGELLARCTRRMEFGDRALGARSFLFLPDDPARSRHLNANLGRDWLMPFGAALPIEEAETLLQGWRPGLLPLARYATVALRATEAMKQRAPATVHVDGTVRAQVVRPQDDPVLHALLMDMPGRVLGNAALRRAGGPIACSLEESAATAARAGAVMLWVS